MTQGHFAELSQHNPTTRQDSGTTTPAPPPRTPPHYLQDSGTTTPHHHTRAATTTPGHHHQGAPPESVGSEFHPSPSGDLKPPSSAAPDCRHPQEHEEPRRHQGLVCVPPSGATATRGSARGYGGARDPARARGSA